MYIFNCIFTGKKVFSDDYSAKIEDDGFVWVVDGKYEELSDQKFDDSLFGGNKSAEGEDVTEYVTEYKPVVNTLLKAFR